MCLAVPVKIEEFNDDDMVRCRVGDSDTFVNASVALLDDELAAGDYLIVHAGFAIRRVDPAEAEETIKLMRQMIHMIDTGEQPV